MIETFKNRHSPMLVLVVLLSVLFSLSIDCAYAEDIGGGGGSHNFGGSYPVWGTVWYGPSPTSNLVGTRYYQYGVVANTKYDAAIYNLELNTGSYADKLTNAKKAKLLSGSNAFKDFADIFKVGKPDLDPSIIFNTDYAVVSAWDSARQMYGETYCFSAMYTLEQKQAALEYARGILDQNDSPSTGGGVGINPDDVGNSTDDQYVLIPAHLWWENTTNKDVEYLAIGVDVYNMLLDYYKDNEGYEFIAIANNYDIDCYMFPSDSYYWDTSNYSLKPNRSLGTMSYVHDGYTVKTIDGHKCLASKATKLSRAVFSKNDYKLSYVGYRNIVSDSTPPATDPDPPIEWPTEPTKPVGGSPDVPGPGDDPTIPLPPEDPTPTPTTPWDPIPDIGIEITGEDFQDLIDALDEHCKHLQQSITSNIGQLWDLQSSYFDSQFSDLVTVITGNLQWLGNDVIVTCFSDLKTYLQELFEWLSDRMDFDINVTNGQYDDTSVIYWLKQIWAALGSGINTEPVDPVTQGDDWWAWLLALMGNFVAMLLAFGSDRLGDVTNAVQTLAGKFPFCLPWDLAAMFALLDATPVIPSFDLPCFALTSNGLSQVGQYHITLEAFDGVWEGIRWVERLGFVVMLIRYTDKLMAVMRRAVGR